MLSDDAGRQGGRLIAKLDGPGAAPASNLRLSPLVRKLKAEASA
jgi:hypothetical protein